MASSLMNRIKKIESSSVSDDEQISAVFVRLVSPGFVDAPVNGWYFGNGDNRVDVYRLDGEDDEQLRRRAADLARESIDGMPRLISL